MKPVIMISKCMNPKTNFTKKYTYIKQYNNNKNKLGQLFVLLNIIEFIQLKKIILNFIRFLSMEQ